MTLLSMIASLPAAVLSVLGLWLVLEVSVRRPERRNAPADEPGSIAVVIPAHNEAAGIAATLRDLKEQLRPQDRLLVVADNCTDITAKVARGEGAEVLERRDEERRGKGYALQFALDHLKDDPPATVLFTDADCLHEAGLLTRVAAEAETTGEPAQALYLMDASETAGASRRVAAFAWRLINKTRMEGLWQLAGTTRLTGAGAAFPWAVAEELALGSGEIVEDLALTLTLAERGVKVRFVPDAVVRSTFPDSEDAATVQRARWEHGSLRMSRTRVPGLLAKGVSAPWKAMLALDVAVPPITVLAAWIIGAVLFGLLMAVFGVLAPLAIAFLAGALTAAGLVIGYLRDGRDVLPTEELLRMPNFLASKFGVYGKAGRASTKSWTRTPRDPDETTR